MHWTSSIPLQSVAPDSPPPVSRVDPDSVADKYSAAIIANRELMFAAIALKVRPRSVQVAPHKGFRLRKDQRRKSDAAVHLHNMSAKSREVQSKSHAPQSSESTERQSLQTQWNGTYNSVTRRTHHPRNPAGKNAIPELKVQSSSNTTPEASALPTAHV